MQIGQSVLLTYKNIVLLNVNMIFYIYRYLLFLFLKRLQHEYLMNILNRINLISKLFPLKAFNVPVHVQMNTHKMKQNTFCKSQWFLSSCMCLILFCKQIIFCIRKILCSGTFVSDEKDIITAEVLLLHTYWITCTFFMKYNNILPCN